MHEDKERNLHRGLSLVLAALTAWNYRALSQTVGGESASGQSLGEALYDPSVASPVIGLVVFAGLIWLRRDRVRRAVGAPAAYPFAAITLAIGSGLLVWSHEIGATDLVMLSFVFSGAGLAAVLGGWALLSSLSMPLLALIVVVPLPILLVHGLVFPMQLGTAAWTSVLLDLIGRSHFLAGDQIFTGGVIFQVIEGCSGMKSTLSLLLAAVVYAELVGKTRRHKATIILLALPVGFLTNGFRVLALVLGEVPSESIEHEAYGLGMIVLGVLMLGIIELAISRVAFVWGESDREADESLPPTTGLSFAPIPRRLAALCILSLAVLIVVHSLRPGTFTTPSSLSFNIERLPRSLEGRKAKGIQYDDQFSGSVSFRHRISRSYEADGEEPVRVFVGFEDDFHREWNGFSNKTRIPRSGWIEIDSINADLHKKTGGERLLIRYPQEEILLDHYRMGYAPWAKELIWSWLGLDRLFGPRSAPALVIRIETNVTDDRRADELRLRQFSEKVWEWYKSSG